MKVVFFVILIFVLLSSTIYGKKSKLKKKGKSGKKSVSLGGDFLGDSTPLPSSVYNLHVDLNKHYELNDFILNGKEKINKKLILMHKEHSNHVKELQGIMGLRQKLIDHLINEIKELKELNEL
ncbi:conserved Plasmodium protein, unknown function [Plasmodium vinckei brucechwatti]|uniref:Uncharacterized protein n=1 Tax=Plasmodium vinckei brucechwatti TaxID=119398 RepID=A0A6V7S9Z6_PLAVN|nr:conserved Plasmodium protein, unknown function [Plasmodium vinckei brucechwatti]